MTQEEKYPDAIELMERLQRSNPFNPIQRRALEECFLSEALRSALRDVLASSDEMLKSIGQADLTQENVIKNSLRAQGIAQGLVQAVEIICALASTPETREETTDG